MKRYHVSKNLCPVNTFKNTETTDTRTFLSLALQAFSDGTYVTQNYTNVSSNGKAIVTLNAPSGTTKLRIVHNGETRNILIADNIAATQGSYTLVVDVVGHEPTVVNGLQLVDIMLVSGLYTLDNMPPYEPYGNEWQTKSPPNYGTGTDVVTNLPVTLYTDGQPITTYSIKGNTTQSGTPTPSNPVAVNGVGERTANLLFKVIRGVNLAANGRLTSASGYDMWFAEVEEGETYVANNVNGTYGFYTDISQQSPITYDEQRVAFSGSQPVITIPVSVKYIGIRTIADTENATLNLGNQPLPYEPWGYKIPILTTQGSAVNYLGSVQSTRKIKKIVFVGSEDENWSVQSAGGGAMRFRYAISNSVQADTAHPTSICTHLPLGAEGGTWNTDDIYTIASNYLWVRLDSSFTTVASLKSWLAQQYANGTPVTVWYVLATPETGMVNELLIKIGDYSDSISNAAAIPTTEGANIISVDTTVQPSEFTATWTGWHDSSVKEWDGSQWQ